jgi:hypothetical protein
MKDNPNWDTFTVTANDAVRNGIMKQEELDDAKATIPEIEFRALYLCEPVDDGTNPFNFDKIKECTIDKMSTLPPAIIGIDIASTVDFTVITGLDVNGNVCLSYRFQGDYNQIFSIIKSLPKCPIVIDSTGVGKPVYDFLMKETKSPIIPFQFTEGSKRSMLSQLASAIHQNQIGFTKMYADNLNNFVAVATSTGYKYVITGNIHDDETMSLGLANWGRMNKPQPTKSYAITQPS